MPSAKIIVEDSILGAITDELVSIGYRAKIEIYGPSLIQLAKQHGHNNSIYQRIKITYKNFTIGIWLEGSQLIISDRAGIEYQKFDINDPQSIDKLFLNLAEQCYVIETFDKILMNEYDYTTCSL